MTSSMTTFFRGSQIGRVTYLPPISARLHVPAAGQDLSETVNIGTLLLGLLVFVSPLLLMLKTSAASGHAAVRLSRLRRRLRAAPTLTVLKSLTGLGVPLTAFRGRSTMGPSPESMGTIGADEIPVPSGERRELGIGDNKAFRSFAVGPLKPSPYPPAFNRPPVGHCGPPGVMHLHRAEQ
jgi:hypothetical protein